MRSPTLLLLVALAPGCISLDVTPARQDLVAASASPGRSAPFRRVGLVPLTHEDGGGSQEAVFRRALQAAVAERGLFELVPLSRRDLEDVDVDATRREGVFGIEDLVRLNDRFGVDGVLSGVVTRFEPYPAMQLGVRLHLIDCRNGRVAWSTDLLLDSTERAVARDVHNFYDTSFSDRTASLIEQEKILVSPRLYARWAASRIADSLRDTLRAQRAAPRPEAAGGHASE